MTTKSNSTLELSRAAPMPLAPQQLIAASPILQMQCQMNAIFADVGRVLRANNQQIEALQTRILLLERSQESAQEQASESALVLHQAKQIEAENAVSQQQQIANLIQQIAVLQEFVQTELVERISFEKADTEQQLLLLKESLELKFR